jgi:U3 small nucleolar RNA-associated protein 22
MEIIPTKKRKAEHQATKQEVTHGATSPSHKDGPENGHARRRLSRHSTQIGGGLPFDPSEMFANGSYKSTLFRLQIDELLSNVQVKRSRREDNIDAVLRSLKKTIEAIPDRGEMTVCSIAGQLYLRAN